MKRLVFLLLVGLGWAAYRHLLERPAAAPRGDSFPFPTSESHAAISMTSNADTASWCEKLGCTEAQLRAAVLAVGSSEVAVRDRLARMG